MRNKFVVLVFIFFYHNAAFASSDGLTFAQAGELAVAASVELRHSISSQAVMEGAWKWRLREYFPRISVNISENDRLLQTGADSFMKNFGLSVDQLIFDGGRTAMSRRLERSELDLSSVRLNRMAGEIAESAISAYRNLLSSRAVLEIKNTALSILEEQRRILSEEVVLGLALPVDLAGADINLANARLEILSLRLELTEFESQFAIILGLDALPELTERVDINRPSVFSSRNAIRISAEAANLAREQNPNLIEAQFSIAKRQAEYRFLRNSWIPTLRLTGSFGLSSQRYPLNRHNWSVGLSVDFSSPWFQNRINAQTGGESDTLTAAVQNGLTPLPDPASSYGAQQARLALVLEQEKYDTIFEQTGRIAANAVEKYILMERRRLLSFEAAQIGRERCRVEELRLDLGHITRLKLMEALIEQTQREIAVVEAATALLEAERELERLLDLRPGELAVFARRHN
ncbi:MAG: TolC family protein [Treponema sp.]|nr:TolC family protein [Treponema sp.]MCL2236794.1 TolC family protein [Treponema sp.]